MPTVSALSVTRYNKSTIPEWFFTSWHVILGGFTEICKHIPISVRIGQQWWVLYIKIYMFLHRSDRAENPRILKATMITLVISSHTDNSGSLWSLQMMQISNVKFWKICQNCNALHTFPHFFLNIQRTKANISFFSHFRNVTSRPSLNKNVLFSCQTIRKKLKTV